MPWTHQLIHALVTGQAEYVHCKFPRASLFWGLTKRNVTCSLFPSPSESPGIVTHRRINLKSSPGRKRAAKAVRIATAVHHYRIWSLPEACVANPMATTKNTSSSPTGKGLVTCWGLTCSQFATHRHAFGILRHAKNFLCAAKTTSLARDLLSFCL